MAVGPEGADTPASVVPAALPDPVAAQLVHAEQSAESASQALAPPTLADEDRSWIARLIVRGFIAAVFAYLLFLAVQGITSGAWVQPAAHAEEMIKTIVVPVVTLVLGYYFGQSTKG